MIRIRFHGRGGQGVKTASRILGTAGFYAGLHAQDAPIYGAERRGAAVAAFTWLSQEPIRERGVITRPDLIMIADETLLADPGSDVCAGIGSASGIFVNSDQSQLPELLRERADDVQALDLTGLTLSLLGRASALSSGLAAAAARMVGGLTLEQLVAALREELRATGLTPLDVEHNEQVARSVFARLRPLVLAERCEAAASEQLVEIGYEGALRGAPSILATGNSALRHTGAWRVERPVIDASHCTRCGLCFVQCPDGAISLDADGYPVIDYDHCKGCLICGHVCPVKAIHEERETHAW